MIKRQLYLNRLVSILCLCIITTVFSPNLASKTAYHTVQPGETLTNIAEMYGYTDQQLILHNRLNTTRSLMIGQKLFFPVTNSGQGTIYNSDIPRQNILYHSSQQPGPMINPPAYPQANGNSNKPPIPFPRTANPIKKAEPTLNSTPYAYYGNGEAVTEVLRSFASNYGLPVIISEHVSSVVNGKIGPLLPVPFLDKLAQLNNLMWYFDGDTLYVYDGQEIGKTIIDLNYMSTGDLKNTLVEMGLWDNRHGWRERPQEGLIYLSGPPRYIELVTQTAKILDAKENEQQKSELAFEVFPLKYAWAEDQSIGYRNQTMTIPGVATLLKRIVQGGQIPNTTSPVDSQTRSQSLIPQTPITGKQPPKLAAQNPGMVPGDTAKNNAQSDVVFINADRRLNAIIIHDLASKMTMYRNLIKTLDKPLSQIEINVSIIDVDTNSINELGVNWRMNNKNNVIGFDPSSNIDSSLSSTVLKVTAGNLIAKVQMLAEKNKAKILSQPSVLTLDNMEAILDNNQTFYVKVQGGDLNNNTAQLYPITSGSVLKVTPRIVKENTGRRIHLDVNIQDGNSEATNSLGNDVTLPVVKNTTISTQAMIHENESLLVGGYFYEKTIDGVSKIPFLGDLPVVGQLFRENRKEYVKNVRLFMITPKIVGLM